MKQEIQNAYNTPPAPKTADTEIISPQTLLDNKEYIDTLREKGLDNHAQVFEKVLQICQAFQDEGGQALLVGGSIRDILLGKITKDFDLEVYKLPAEKVEKVAKQLGKVSDVGRAFGILKISIDGIDIDISLPRTDSKIGTGHKGFAVKADPNMSIKDAARRRDFTINSMAADPLSSTIYDPFGGAEDLKNRTLRITDEERFRDDPLRVMRAIQFIGRFGLKLEERTSQIIQEMIPKLKELPKERIYEEWKKLLLKSEKPSLGLATGMTLGVWQEIHPQFTALTQTPQDKEWHPEGDVWMHTLMCVDEAAQIMRRENLSEGNSLSILLSTLCHDLGKPLVTEFKDGRYISHGHEEKGEEPTKQFLDSLGVDNLTRDKVIKLVTNHLIPTMFYCSEVVRNEKISDGAIRRLAKRIDPATIQELVLVAKADHFGRGQFFDAEIPDQLLVSREFPAGDWLIKRARQLKVEKSKPTDVIQGRDLQLMGLKAGRDFGQIIRLANNLRDDKNYTREQILAEFAGLSDTKLAIEKLNELN